MPILLLIEDDAQLRRALKRVLGRVLRERALELREAANGQEALDALKECTPALIICDLDMPVMTGVEFLCARSEAQKEIPLVLHSANGDLAVIAETHNVRFAIKGEGTAGLPALVESLLP